jgi:hypothetical protein
LVTSRIGYDRLHGRPTRDIATEPVDRDRPIAVGPDPKLERVARRVRPHFVGIDPMPVRPLAGRQQIDDRTAAGAPAVR